MSPFEQAMAQLAVKLVVWFYSVAAVAAVGFVGSFFA